MAFPGSHEPIVLHCDNVWIDPPGHFEPKSVEMAGGRIEAVRDRTPAPATGTSNTGIDLGGAYLMPGLINTHVHLEFSASPYPLRDFNGESVSARMARAIRNARSMLRSGVTTVRDCGSSLDLLYHVRRNRDRHVLPRLLLSGPPITVPGGHLGVFGGEVRGPDDVAAVVSRLISAGAMSLKLMGSGGVMTPGTHPENVAFSQDLFCQVADAARTHNVASVVHVLATKSVKRAALARFDSLEHCAFFCRSANGRLERKYDAVVAGIVADCGVAIMANLSTATRSHGTLLLEGKQGNLDSQHALDQHDVMLENFAKFVDLGIPIVCGTDAGVRDTPFEDTWVELELMARSGMSNVEVIRSASLTGAHVLKLDGKVGRIAAGYSADFVVLKESPLSDISSYRCPLDVFSAGHRIDLASSRGTG
ncbi:MAG: amidohydrolase family protein [Paracoccaceae bacterium]|nr:amidohydrolase family protein [Paracoccaceae bacterium]